MAIIQPVLRIRCGVRTSSFLGSELLNCWLEASFLPLLPLAYVCFQKTPGTLRIGPVLEVLATSRLTVAGQRVRTNVI